MTKRQWLNRKVVGVGEAMVEFAPVGQNIYRRGFAGDTLNTCWHIAQIIRDRGEVGYFAKVGIDTPQQSFSTFFRAAELGRIRLPEIRRDRSAFMLSASLAPSGVSAIGATPPRRDAWPTISMNFLRSFWGQA